MPSRHPLFPVPVLVLVALAWLWLAVGCTDPTVSGPTRPGGGVGVQSTGGDCDIRWNEVRHDTFDPVYRSVVGPATPGQTVRLRLRVAQGDLTSARLRLWDARAKTESYLNLAWDRAFDRDPTTYDYWTVEVPIATQPTILYYFFELNDNGGGTCPAGRSPVRAWYVDDDIQFTGGGLGVMTAAYNDRQSFQITVYDPKFSVPEWMQRGVVYQIFPDRFRDGTPANDPAAGRFSYAEPGGAIVRSGGTAWNTEMCDPRTPAAYGKGCPGRYGDNFYGGDLQGITEKIQQGFFDNLGVSVLYLNPIFRSPSNHKYDTADYMTIDPDFGTLADFQAMTQAAHAHGIKIILDGVFNHVSSDSKYFDRYDRYNAQGNLTSPNGRGANDDSGACESGTSAFYSWFYFPAVSKPGQDGDTPVLCPNGPNRAGQSYEAWFGYSSLPKLRANAPAVRNLIWAKGDQSVGPYWVKQGADGWRFDVGADVDPGLTGDSGNDYWEGFRAAVRDAGVTGKTDTLLLGEEWGDASPWLLGNEWDSAMNYRFRSTVLSWLMTGCNGPGCTDGARFEDNDLNVNSSSGPLTPLSPSQFNARLRSIQEDYPPMAFKAMMNLAGSHDTNRVRFLLKKVNRDDDTVAAQRMKELWLFAFTYAGAPTVYYGDEVGLSHDGVFSNGKYEDDPYNRVPYPWDDTPGTYGADTTNLLPHLRKMASLRWSYRALQDGDVLHGVVINDQNKVYGFARARDGQTALIALNRDNAAHGVTFAGLKGAPYNLSDGTVLVDALNGGMYSVSGGQVSVTVNSNWGVVLLKQSEIDTPAAPAVTRQTAGADVRLTWPAVVTDTRGEREVVTRYDVYRGTTAGFAPAPNNLVGTVTPPPFGSPDGKLGYTDPNAAPGNFFYAVRAVNGAGVGSSAR